MEHIPINTLAKPYYSKPACVLHVFILKHVDGLRLARAKLNIKSSEKTEGSVGKHEIGGTHQFLFKLR